LSDTNSVSVAVFYEWSMKSYGLMKPAAFDKKVFYFWDHAMNGFHFIRYFVEKKAESLRLIGLECAMEFRLCA
jgi:hypothetical protein